MELSFYLLAKDVVENMNEEEYKFYVDRCIEIYKNIENKEYYSEYISSYLEFLETILLHYENNEGKKLVKER